MQHICDVVRTHLLYPTVSLDTDMDTDLLGLTLNLYLTHVPCTPVHNDTDIEVHERMYTYVCTSIHTCIYTHTQIHTFAQRYIHTYIHTYIYTYIHTYADAHAHT